MNTKTYAQEARRNLLEAVSKKLHYWGFSKDGVFTEQPQKIAGGYLFRGKVHNIPEVPKLWNKLHAAINKHGIDEVIEKAAYTWFNRITALRILSKNGYEQAELEYVKGITLTPQILQRARQGKYDFLSKTEQERLKKIITDYSKDQEAFAILLIGYCHSHPTLKRVFGGIDDYTELLLPDNILQKSGFLHLLNTMDAISDEEYQKVELIGWLYQFYISEKKDDVFASFKKNKKVEAKDIPAATQIFTPNWIVKYMVENTAGKIWLDKNPDSPLKSQMKYLVENESDGTSEPIINNVEELTLIDPAAGSGHILVEGFELLYQMYMEEYYTPEEAVESILSNNLYGLDIDDRAAQLATFAILLKAARVYPDVWQKDWLPNVYAMPEAQYFSMQEVKDFLGAEGIEYIEELEAALGLMKQAKNLGSVMKLNVSEKARTFIKQRFTALEHTEYRDFNIEAIYQNLKPYIPVLLILTKKYTSVVANPPYMGQKNMNADLKNYVKAHYPLTRIDLYAIFMECGLELSQGLLGMINQHSWMFISTFEKFRKLLFKNYGFLNMIHLGPRAFEELGGEVVQSTAFILGSKVNSIATYHRLVAYNNISDKETAFLNRRNEYRNISQEEFSKIPGFPMAYWLSNKTIELFKQNKISDYSESKAGIVSGKDAEFIRFWHETSSKEISFKEISFPNKSEVIWVPINKGGSLKKYYGNNEHIIHLKNLWTEGKTTKSVRRGDPEYYFKKAITWSYISNVKFGFRATENVVFATQSPALFFKDDNYFDYTYGFLNSKIAELILPAINPTISLVSGNVESLPLIYDEESIGLISKLVQYQRDITKKDWDSRETSWDFEQSPLLNATNALEQSVQTWQAQVAQDFFQLHTNEEELNLIFIDIYGLQEELTPEVPLKDITILQEELNKKDMEALEDNFRDNGAEAIELPIDKGEVISQFISYAIGLFMGRYRLDKPGLNISHPNPTGEELESYSYKNGKVIIDEDAILPLMGSRANFPDDVYNQINELLDTIWGADTRTENVNFIQECLGRDLEKFIVKDFWKYHCSMYKKKPIYWLFSSKKGAFQVLVYMHRMNEFTVEKIRANYLIEHMKYLRSEIDIFDQQGANISSQEAKKLDQMRKDLMDCEEYDLLLKDTADQQIKFDLDDGVDPNYNLFKEVTARII